jgi:cell filamentation protein
VKIRVHSWLKKEINTMILENKLNLTDQSALARAEEELSKRKAKQLFDLGDIEK